MRKAPAWEAHDMLSGPVTTSSSCLGALLAPFIHYDTATIHPDLAPNPFDETHQPCYHPHR
ncbi:unnamed protein product [Urochloa humidicola]